MQQMQQILAETGFSAPQDFLEEMYAGSKDNKTRQKELLSPQAEKAYALLFVRSGKLKCSCLVDDHEVLLDFVQAGEVILFFPCACNQLWSNTRIEVLESGEVSTLSRQQWDKLSKEYPVHCLELENAILRSACCHARTQAAILRLPYLKDRLEAWKQVNPLLFEELPHTLKAIFLGTHPQTIYKIVREKQQDETEDDKKDFLTK